MLIDECVSSVIIVDNKKEELEPLKEMFEKHDIHVDSFLYGTEPLRTFSRNRQLVFIDLLLNENAGQDKENMSLLISALSTLCSDTFGLYGLVVWTKHPEKVEELKKNISQVSFGVADEKKQDDEEEEAKSRHIQPPLFVIGLNKNKYIEAGYDYSSLPQEFESMLENEPAAYFFFKWSASVQASKDKTIKGIYQIIHDYQKQEKQLPYILYQLALNHTGAPSHHANVTVDAYKAFDELFYSDLMMLQRDETIPVFDPNIQNTLGNEYEYKLKLSGMLNEHICIDVSAIAQSMIVPGNVYKVKDADSPLKIKIDEKPHSANLQNVDEATIEYIAIEMTPPCDFSQKYKKMSRLVGGYVFDIPIVKDPKNNNNYIKFSCNRTEKTYDLWPVAIGDKKARCIVFDFRYLYSPRDADILDPSKYEVWFRAKPKLFSDVLQKFSSHASRLGLSSLNLAK